MTEYVYLIGAADNHLVKIGRSIDVAGRLAAIQRMSPTKLSVLWKTEGGAWLETALHRKLKEARSHGEWFEFPDRDAPERVEAAVREIVSARETATQRRRKQWADGRTADEELVGLAEARRVLEAIWNIADPIERGRRATELINRATTTINSLSAARREVIDQVQADMSPAEIARAFSLTRARVSQILHSGGAGCVS